MTLPSEVVDTEFIQELAHEEDEINEEVARRVLRESDTYIGGLTLDEYEMLVDQTTQWLQEVVPVLGETPTGHIKNAMRVVEDFAVNARHDKPISAKKAEYALDELQEALDKT